MSDLIDRQSAIKAINEIIAVTPTQIDTVSDCIDVVNRLPSVQPKPKTGKWIIHSFSRDAQCSVCGRWFVDVYDLENSDAYCRCCGAKMTGLDVIDDE